MKYFIFKKKRNTQVGKNGDGLPTILKAWGCMDIC